MPTLTNNQTIAIVVVAILFVVFLYVQSRASQSNSTNSSLVHATNSADIPQEIMSLTTTVSEHSTKVNGLNSNFSNLSNQFNDLVAKLSRSQQKLSPNAVANIITNILTPLYNNGVGHKGLFALFGNAELEDERFAAVGEAAPGKPWTVDTSIGFASVGKLITGTVFAKMCEEGLIQPQDLVVSYVPEFTGLVNYYSGMSVSTANDPGTWTPTYATFDLATLTVNQLLNMNFPIGYGGLFHLGILGFAFPWNAANFAAQSGQGLLGQASAHQLYTFRQMHLVNGATGDIFVDKYKGTTITSSTPVKDWLNYILNLTKTQQLSLLFKPGTSMDSLLPSKISNTAAQYTLGFHYLGWVMDNCLRSKGYSGGFAQYLRSKFLVPMNTSTVYTIGQEATIQNVPRAAISFRRVPPIASSATILTTSMGVSPEYISDGKVGQLVWEHEYPNDGIVRLENGVDYSPHNPNDIPNGGTPIVSSPKDFAKFIKLILNQGVHGANRLLSPQTVNWMTTPSISAGLNMYFAYPLASVDSTSSSFCPGGFNRYNRDLVGPSQIYPSSDSFCTMSGSSGLIMGFDLKAKTYVILGTLEPIWGAVAPAYRDDNTVARVLTQATRSI